MTTSNRFDAKDPSEKRVLTFDFSADLVPGETITGTPVVAISVVGGGTDPSPTAVLAGGNSFDTAHVLYYVPVTGGLSGVDYDIVVKAATTTSSKTLALGGILPVRSQ